MKEKNETVSQLLLERYLLKELPPDKMKEMDLRLEQDPDLQNEIDLLRRSNEDILDRYPAPSMTAEILDRYELEKKKEQILAQQAKTPVIRRLLMASPAVALLLVLFFVGLPIYKDIINKPSPHPMDIEPGIRTKGLKRGLVIFRKTGEEAELLEQGMKAKEGDLLQIAYIAAGEKYGVILSLDGNGVATLHFPAKPSGSTALQQGKKILLGNSYELDDAPQYERFFFITSDAPIDVVAVMAKAEAHAVNTGNARSEALPLAGSLKQTSLLIVKGE